MNYSYIDYERSPVSFSQTNDIVLIFLNPHFSIPIHVYVFRGEKDIHFVTLYEVSL